MWRLNAGIVSATSKAVAAPPNTTGWRITAPTTAAQKRESPSLARMRARNGIRPRSTRSPSLANTAGRTVSEPISAMATTSTVPMPKDAKVGEPIRNMPAIAVITTKPENSTARPDVAAAVCSASLLVRPRARSSRARRR